LKIPIYFVHFTTRNNNHFTSRIHAKYIRTCTPRKGCWADAFE
jgi:hypothetical protein